MPLDDREQKILEEIERQFYEEDPELARAVEKISRPSATRVRLAALGAILGLTVILVFFAQNTVLALVGFAVLVASITVLVPAIRERVTPESDPGSGTDQIE